MLILLAAAAASFLYVFLKAFQQLNVMHHKIPWVIPTSVGMAAFELVIVLSIVKSPSVWMILALGLGGGTGCITSMFLHKWLREKAFSAT